jgi:UPF0755 protein
VVTRRLVALTLVGAVVALAIWVAVIATREFGHDDTKTVPTVTARPSRPFRIVFPEGFDRRDMAERITAVNRIAKHERGVMPRLSAAEYLAATARSSFSRRFAGDRKERSLEGFLFPATYDFTDKTTSRELVREQLATFRREWTRVDLRYARSKNLTPYDVLTIASMIEKEVRVPAERRLVAAVIYNRLHRRMTLGIDATVRYGLGVPATRSLTAAELDNPTPYNTRLHQGLPPTPIANPGLASMQAAAHPAHVDYLYFVRKPDKRHHFFTASDAAFEAYKQAHGYK